MIRLIYLIFGKRVGRIIAGVIFLVLGLIFLQLNLSDTTFTSKSDWFYCAVLLLAGVVLLAWGMVSMVRKQPAQSSQPQPPAAGQPYNQWAQPPAAGQPYNQWAQPPAAGQPYNQWAQPPAGQQLPPR
jgi:hypothetical protein